METTDTTDPVREEQFGDHENNPETMKKPAEDSKLAVNPSSESESREIINLPEANGNGPKEDPPENPDGDPTEEISEQPVSGSESQNPLPGETEEKIPEQEKSPLEDPDPEKITTERNTSSPKDSEEPADSEDKSIDSAEKSTVSANGNAGIEKDPVGEKAEEAVASESKDTDQEGQVSKSDSVTQDESGEKDPDGTNGEEITVKSVDYSTFSIDDLVNTLNILIEERPVQEIRNDVENIKISFYKKLKAEFEQKRKKFLEEGGELKDFMPVEDPREKWMKDLLKKYKEAKSTYNKNLELQKQTNLKEKYQIIEEIKDLVNRKESINKTFQEFWDLQARWRTVGVVPQQNLKDLWGTYHHHVEKFYDYIKINKELRDLDLKKNKELKITLCEKAEELLLEPSAVNAFKKLQKYHEQWREIGPVPQEMKTELWERFREATSKINKKHQEYYENLVTIQKKNLEAKTHLCQQVEEINNKILTSHKEWDKHSMKLVEIQKIWRTIGYAPKKSNNRIYQQFRDACDTFFRKKREFYAENKEIQNNNLQLKTELCTQAEALQDNSDWKKTTEELINLQKQWKKIGPVQKKHSEKIWKRFRAACDTFFQRKSDYFSKIDNKYEENLILKKQLIKEIEDFKPGKDMEENFETIKNLQRKWTDIGFVPYGYKDEILQSYRNAINKQFDNLNVDEEQKNLFKYKNKLVNLQDNPKATIKIQQDRDKFLNKIKQLESDIVLWENNIGFFAKSENANSMINEVNEKIKKAKKSILFLEEKIELIDHSNLDTGY